MVKELISQIPISVRKFKIRLIENVSQADFIQAARTEELCEAVEGIPHHAVANSLVEGHGYAQKFLEITAPLKDALYGLAGEYYIDDNKILSYKKVNTRDVAGLLDLPEEVKNMQLVIPSRALILDTEEDEIIDLIAIRKRETRVIQEAEAVGQTNQVTNSDQEEALKKWIK